MRPNLEKQNRIENRSSETILMTRRIQRGHSAATDRTGACGFAAYYQISSDHDWCALLPWRQNFFTFIPRKIYVFKKGTNM